MSDADQFRISQDRNALLIPLLVSPRASKERVGPIVGDRLKVFVKAPPVEGKANEAVKNLLAKILGIRRQDVEIAAGSTGKRKVVRVQGVSHQEAFMRLLPPKVG